MSSLTSRACAKTEKRRETRPIRILFLGNAYSSFSVRCLEALFEQASDRGYEIVPGFYDPAKVGAWRTLRNLVRSRGSGPALERALRFAFSKASSGLRLAGLPVKGYQSLPELARAHGAEPLSCSNPNSAEFIERVKRLEIDLIVVANFSRILKRGIIEAPRMGCINVHPSLLPRYRGPEPHFWVLANGETTTGVTLLYIDEGIDTGDILLQAEMKVRRSDTEAKLWKRSGELASGLLRKALPLLASGQAPRVPQDHTLATYYSFRPRRGQAAEQRKAAQARTSSGAGSAEPLHLLDPLKDQRWPAFVQAHPNASVFHTMPWLEALRRTYGYKPVACTTSAPESELRNALLFCEVDSWITGRRLVSVPFSDHCEPLVDKLQDLDCMLRNLETYCQSRGWRYVELRPSNGLLGVSPQSGFQPSQKYYLHTVDLRPGEQELLRRLQTSMRYRIRRAEREGLHCEKGRSEALLDNLYRLSVMTRQRRSPKPGFGTW